MSLFGNIRKFFGGLLGGGDDDEEKKKRQQQGPTQNFQSSVVNAGSPPAQSSGISQPQQSQQPVNGLNLALPGMTPNIKGGLPSLLEKAQPKDTRSDGQKELERLTAENLPKALEEEKGRTSWLDRTLTDRDWNKRAENTARSRAVAQYSETHGYGTPESKMYGAETGRRGDELVEGARRGGERLQKVANVATKVGQVAQYVPVTGSVLNLGLAGSEKLAKASGNDAYAKDLHEQRDLNEFSMTPEQMAALDPETRGKLETIRKIGYGLAPLDVLGFGGLAKAEGVQLAKKGATQLLKEGTVDTATRQAIKTAGVQTAKDLAVPAALGTGITLGGQQYLTGEMDPLEAAKNGLLVGGTSLLFPGRRNPGAALQKAPDEVAPGLKSANQNVEVDAANQIEAANPVPAFQRGYGEQPTAQDLYKADSSAARRATSQPGQTYDAGLDPNSQLDAVPAFQRKGLDAPDASKARIKDLEAQIATMPTDDQARSIKFDLDKKYGAMLNASPAQGDVVRQRLAEAKAKVDEGIATRATLEQELTTLRLGKNENPPVASSTPVPATPAALPEAAGAAPTPAAVAPEAPLQTSGEPTVAEMVGTNTRPEAALQTAIEQAHNAGDDAKVAQLIEQLPEDMKAPMRSALGIQEPATVATPPAIPEPAVVEQAPAAPNTHDALVRSLGPEAKGRKGDYAMRDVIKLDELKQKAAGAIANMDDQQLVNTFSTTSPEMLVHDPQSFSLARAALDRLYVMTDNPVAEQQVTNILDGMAKYTSKNAQGLRLVQEEFDNMPLPMKVRYIVKKIDAANVDTKNYEPLARDPAKAAQVEAILNGHLQTSQNVAERVAGIEDQLSRIAEAAKNGEKVDADIKGLTKTLQTERQNLAANNGELVKYFQTLVPGRTGAQRALVDFPKRMMLFSATGRINDLLTTSSNIVHQTAQNFTQGLIAKAVNLFKPGKVSDTWQGGGRIFTGGARGLKKTVGEVRGTQYVDNLEKSLRGNEDLRSGLRKANGPVGRTIQAATEMATNVSEGVRDQRLYQLAHQEGTQAGLRGNDLEVYAQARAAVPSRQMMDSAEQLHLQLNNLNENPVTRALNRVSAGIEGKSALGGVLKNQIMPFTSWLGGNIYNTITDKNVVASTIKFARDAARGDAEGAVRNLAATINGAVQAYALGYALTKSGLITNENAEGYNDAGAYFHIGDRYIPVGFTGFFAPNIILGNAAYNGLENNNGENPAEVIGKNIIGNIAASINLTGALGADTGLTRAIDAKNRPGGDWGDAGAVGGANVAGQFIPGLTGDVNAVLNNGLELGGVTVVPDALNPTHERADTKVVDPNSPSGTAKDYPKSAVASLVNRIPVASQLMLPRKEGVAAPDLLDRATRGDRDTAASKDARATAKTEAEQAEDWKTRDVPNFREKNFDDAVEARVQRGEYDKAIEAMQAKLDDQKKNKDIPDSKNKALADDIKLFQVLKAGSFEPAMRDLYKSTSLTEWRNMGDPESDTYNPEAYQKLYDFDSALVKESISGSSLDKSGNKFTAKKPGKGRGGSSDPELSRIKSNTIGNTPSLAKISLGDLQPQKAGSIKMPTIQQVKPGELVKKRAISVRKA